LRADELRWASFHWASLRSASLHVDELLGSSWRNFEWPGDDNCRDEEA
jgi:hypothetical protein